MQDVPGVDCPQVERVRVLGVPVEVVGSGHCESGFREAQIRPPAAGEERYQARGGDVSVGLRRSIAGVQAEVAAPEGFTKWRHS